MSKPFRRPLSLILLSLLCLAISLPADAASHPARKGKPSTKAKSKASTASAAALPSFGQRADVMAFADAHATELGLDAAQLRQWLAQARIHPAVQRLIMPPPVGTAKDWGAYRARFVERRRLQAGLNFWQQHEAALARAEERHGVPAHIIVGIIGVETFYGQIMGGFSVLDALATLSFEFPPGRKDRSEFFRSELLAYFQLCQREGLDPTQLKGSYAGAMGWGQFMPSSWNRYAVDHDGDGHAHLISNPVDAIGSVAHFLAQHGWQSGMIPTFSLAMPVDTTARATLLAPDIKPSFSAAQLIELGALPSEAAREHRGPMAVVELQMGSAAPIHVLGTENFYALTRYNWSSYYAMAVIELGQAVQRMRQEALGTSTGAVSRPD